jgi:hypothetical protein
VARAADGTADGLIEPGQLVPGTAGFIDTVDLVDFGEARGDEQGITVRTPVEQAGRADVLVAAELLTDLLGDLGDALKDNVARVGRAFVDLSRRDRAQQGEGQSREQH